MSIEEICKKYGIKNYTINDDGSIDVDGDVYINDEGLTELPLTFNKVTGVFNCDDNKLTTLKGSPKSVGGGFDCDGNKLTDLKGSPKSIGGKFYCRNNPIESIFNYVDIDFIKAFKSFKVLNNGVIDLKRLKYLMSTFNKPIDLESIKKYYTIK